MTEKIDGENVSITWLWHGRKNRALFDKISFVDMLKLKKRAETDKIGIRMEERNTQAEH